MMPNRLSAWARQAPVKPSLFPLVFRNQQPCKTGLFFYGKRALIYIKSNSHKADSAHTETVFPYRLL
jgi:hypothetical protein